MRVRSESPHRQHSDYPRFVHSGTNEVQDQKANLSLYKMLYNNKNRTYEKSHGQKD